MAAWKFSVGNAATRAANAPASVAPAASDPDLPLSRLANDYPDVLAAFAWRQDGTYEADIDLNMLASSSSRADAPTGWGDYRNRLAGVPGLPANPVEAGTFAGRDALKFYRPIFQDVPVLPGETVGLEVGLRLPAGTTATGVRARVVDLASGLGWDDPYDWTVDGIAAEHGADTWLDVSVTIDADAARTERTLYRVVLEPVAAAYDATTFAYASDPALFPECDLAAVIGHNLPEAATVTVGTIELEPVQPSFFGELDAPVLERVLRLSIQMPAGEYPRPILGELWIGKGREMICTSPVMPVGVAEESKGQLRLEGSRGRLEIVGEDAVPAAEMELAFRVTSDAAYQQIRDELARLTRFGADPVVIFPSAAFELGRFYHGRVGQKVSYQRLTPAENATDQTVRAFTLPFTESPFSAT